MSQLSVAVHSTEPAHAEPPSQVMSHVDPAPMRAVRRHTPALSEADIADPDNDPLADQRRRQVPHG